MKRENLFLGGAVAFVGIALVLRPGPPAANTRLPDFAVETPAGAPLRAADLAGKVALVNIWASWCAPCREELPALNALAARYDTAQVVFAALSDDVDGVAAREFLLLGSLPHMRVGLGLGALKATFRYPGLPFTVLTDRDGRIVRTWYGYGGPPQLAAIDSLVRHLTGQQAPRDSLHLAFVGDINMARSLARAYLFTGRGAEVFAGVRDSLRAADLAVGNLESILLERGRRADTNSSPVFAGPVRESIPLLLDAGFDVIGTANNHAWDFGRAGLLESFGHLTAAGIAHTGTGPDLDAAYRPVVVRRNGWTVAIFALTYIFNYEDLTVRGHAAECCVAWADSVVMREKIRAVRDSAGADRVILYVHAGMEYRLVPEPDVVRMFRALVRHSGADAVIGHHPHVPQGMEVLDGRPIVYSLGNFVFRQRTAWTNRGLWAALTYFPDGTHRLTLRPLVVGYTPAFATGNDSSLTMARVDSSSRRISRLQEPRPRRNVGPR